MAPPSVAVLGTGLMGGKMAIRLSQQGFQVTAWNRASSKAQEVAKGTSIKVAATVQEAVQACEVVLLMLADAPAIEAVLLADGVQLTGKTVMMMSTIGPAESQAICAQAKAQGATYLECPVLGSKPEAESGTLQILVGSEQHPESSAAWPVLCALSQMPRHTGPVGSAAAMKLALNQLIVIETLGFSASLGLVQRTGGDIAQFMDVLRASALYAPTFDKKLAKYLTRDFGTANFPTKHLLKDARLFCEQAEVHGLDTRVQRAAEAMCHTTCERPGLADADYSAVFESVVHPSSAPQQ